MTAGKIDLYIIWNHFWIQYTEIYFCTDLICLYFLCFKKSFVEDFINEDAVNVIWLFK